MSTDHLGSKTVGLSAAQLALLEQRLKGKTARPPATRRIPRRTSTEFAPLSFTQEETMRLTQTHEMPPSYVGTVLSYSGPLDSRALQLSVDEMSRRHESLRTSIVTIDGETRQRIHPSAAAKVTTEDLSDELPDKKIARVQQLAAQAMAQPFDLEQAPLWRLKVFRLSGEEYVLAIALHHLMADFLSLGILIQELGTLYAAFAQQQPSPLPELPISYGDWAAWQREQVRNGELEPQFSYWLVRLKDFPPALELPFTRKEPAVPTLRGAIRLAEFPVALSDALRELSRTHHVSLYTTLLAGFGLLIKSYTGRDDFVLGRGVTGRTRIETERLIGCFVNMVSMRLDLSGNPNFVELLKRVQGVVDGAYANQDVPSSKLAERLHGDKATPLARLFFNLYTAPSGSGSEPAGASIKAFDLGDERRKDDVTLFQQMLFGMQDVGGRLVAELKFNRDVFDVPAMDQMLEQYQVLLQTIVAAPTQQIEDLIRQGSPKKAQDA